MQFFGVKQTFLIIVFYYFFEATLFKKTKTKQKEIKTNPYLLAIFYMKTCCNNTD